MNFKALFCCLMMSLFPPCLPLSAAGSLRVRTLTNLRDCTHLHLDFRGRASLVVVAGFGALLRLRYYSNRGGHLASEKALTPKKFLRNCTTSDAFVISHFREWPRLYTFRHLAPRARHVLLFPRRDCKGIVLACNWVLYSLSLSPRFSVR
jgi:hypothetical protein